LDLYSCYLSCSAVYSFSLFGVDIEVIGRVGTAHHFSILYWCALHTLPDGLAMTD
jgi:hypothetical protein